MAWRKLAFLTETEDALAYHEADTDAHKGQRRSVELDEGDLQLVGDVDAPGADKVYGTDEEGARTWREVPPGMEEHGNEYHDPNFAEEAAFLAHAARHSPDEADPVPDDFLINLVKACNFVFVPTAAGWTEAVTGEGNIRQEPMRNVVEITDNQAGSARAYTACMGFNVGNVYGRVNYDKHFYLVFNYAVFRPEADLTCRIQVKESTALGPLAQLGFGLEVVDLAMTGESYKTARGTISLGNLEVINTGPHVKQVQVIIELDPTTPAVKFYINGALAGSITNPDHVPSELGTTATYIMHSINRPGAGTSGVVSVFMQGKFWQEL